MFDEITLFSEKEIFLEYMTLLMFNLFDLPTLLF